MNKQPPKLSSERLARFGSDGSDLIVDGKTLGQKQPAPEPKPAPEKPKQ